MDDQGRVCLLGAAICAAGLEAGLGPNSYHLVQYPHLRALCGAIEPNHDHSRWNECTEIVWACNDDSEADDALRVAKVADELGAR